MEAKLSAVLLTAVAPIAWGSTYFVTRHWLPADLPLTAAAIRALPAGLLLLLVARRLPRGSWWWRSAVISTLSIGGFFVLIYVAGTRLPSGVAATLMATSALVTVVLAKLLLAERLAAKKWVGAGLGFAGVALLVNGAASGLDPWGVGASVLAMASASLGFVLTKRWKPPVPALTFTAWQLTFAGALLVPVALLIEGAPRTFAAAELAAFTYVGVVATAVAYVAWFAGLARLEAGTVSIIGLLNPLTGALLGIAVAGELLSSAQWVGAVLILGGVVLGVYKAGRRGRIDPGPAAPMGGDQERVPVAVGPRSAARSDCR